MVLRKWPGSWAVCCFYLLSGVDKYGYALHEKSLDFLQPSCLYPLVFSVAKEVIFPMSDPRPQCSICGLNCLVPREVIYPCHTPPPPFCVPSCGTGPNLIASLPFLRDSVWMFLTALVVQKSFCQSPVSFQEEFLHMLLYFWCVDGEELSSALFYSAILVSPGIKNTLKKVIIILPFQYVW